MLDIWDKDRDHFLNLSLNFLICIIISNHKIISYRELYAGKGTWACVITCLYFMGSSPLLSTVNLESLRIYSVIPTDNLKKNAKYSDKNPIKKKKS